MSHTVSTEGCKVKWQQRNRQKRGQKRAKDSDGSDDDDLIGSLLNQMEAKIPRPQRDVYRSRPSDDGIFHNVTQNRRKGKNQKTASTSRDTRNNADKEPNMPVEFQQIMYDTASSEEAQDELTRFMDQLIEGEFEVSEWQSRKAANEYNWEAARSKILSIYVESHCDPQELILCEFCLNAAATLKCMDCLGAFICPDCDVLYHSHQPCHDRLGWQNGYFENLPQEYRFPTTDSSTPCFKCGKNTKLVDGGKYIAITVKGRFDVPRYKTVCSNCNTMQRDEELGNLIRRGFWPGDPEMKSSYIFQQKLLDLWHHVSMNLPGSSMSGFLHALEDISTQFGRAGHIDQTMFSRASSEYGYLQDSILLMKNRDHMKCPPCSVNQTMCHIDGNHKVYRYKHVEKESVANTRTPYHSKRFIEPDTDVEAYVDKVYKAHPSKSSASIYCGPTRWKAARDVAKRRAKLDETGLVVAGCRHAIAQKAVNMKHGELYGYAHYLQIKWGGRYVKDAGSGSGEDMEQVFSHLSRTGNTTKYMGKAARIDTITNHMLFWNGRKIKHLPELLCKRYKKVKQSQRENEMDLELSTGELNIVKRKTLLEKWEKDVNKAAEDATPRRRTNPSTDNIFRVRQQIREAESLKQYVKGSSSGLSTVLGSSQLYQLAAEHCAKAEKLPITTNDSDEADRVALIKKSVHKLQLEVEVATHAYHQRRHDMDKLADTSKQRMKLRRKLDTDREKIDKLLSKLSDVESLLTTSTTHYDLSLILEAKFPWQQNTSTSWSTKKTAVDSYMLHQRMQEEEKLLVKEMRNLLAFYQEVYQELKKDIADLSTELQVVGTEGDENVCADAVDEGVTSLRYTIDVHRKTPGVVKGMHNLKYTGLLETRATINRALSCFKQVLTPNGWETMNFDFLDSDGEDEDEDGEGDEEESPGSYHEDADKDGDEKESPDSSRKDADKDSDEVECPDQ